MTGIHCRDNRQSKKTAVKARVLGEGKQPPLRAHTSLRKKWGKSGLQTALLYFLYKMLAYIKKLL